MIQIFTKVVRGTSNAAQSLKNLVATLSVIPIDRSGRRKKPTRMQEQVRVEMSLHGFAGRKYLNGEERRRFLKAARKMSPEVRLFCLVLMWSGCRISEALAITPSAIDLGGGFVALKTLKRRKLGVVREVPLPPSVLRDLNRVFDLRLRQNDPTMTARRLWPWSRSTAWRYIKRVMSAAGISGAAAMPKGLRHAFGVAAFEAVPPHIVQRWLGHASLRTTAIYGEVSGREERIFAERIWNRW